MKMVMHSEAGHMSHVDDISEKGNSIIVISALALRDILYGNVGDL